MLVPEPETVKSVVDRLVVVAVVPVALVNVRVEREEAPWTVRVEDA